MDTNLMYQVIIINFEKRNLLIHQTRFYGKMPKATLSTQAGSQNILKILSYFSFGTVFSEQIKFLASGVTVKPE